MWYQYQHDKNYHHDIYCLPTMRRIQHLVNHISKYHRRNFNETDINQFTHLYKDTVACIFSIAHTLGFNIGPYISTDARIGYVEELWFDQYAVYARMTDALDRMTKAIEGYDHIEDIDYRGVMTDALIVLLRCTFQLHHTGVTGRKNPELPFNESVMVLLQMWYDQLENIKVKHCFHDYFLEESNRSTKHLEVRQLFNMR